MPDAQFEDLFQRDDQPLPE
jgi:hypothetical protein